MKIETVIGIPARGSGPVGGSYSHRKGNGKNIPFDKEKLRKLADQLMDLTEELQDIQEDLHEMFSGMECRYDSGDYDDERASEPLDIMDDICSNVDSAFEELNEALDGMSLLGD